MTVHRHVTKMNNATETTDAIIHIGIEHLPDSGVNSEHSVAKLGMNKCGNLNT